MNEQQLKQELEAILINLSGVIPPLQTLSEDANKKIDERLDNSLQKVDEAINSLNKATDNNTSFITTAEQQAIQHLKSGVQDLVSQDIVPAYQVSINQVIERLEYLLKDKASEELQRISEHKIQSIDTHNKQIQNINTDIQASISQLRELQQKISNQADIKLEELQRLSTVHTQAIQAIENKTDSSVDSLAEKIDSVESIASFIARFPLLITVIVSLFSVLNLSFLIAIANRLRLWKEFFMSILSLTAFALIIVLIFGVALAVRDRYKNKSE